MMLAAVDAKTYGFYEDYAVDWQNGPGCQVISLATLHLVVVIIATVILSYHGNHIVTT